MTDTKAPPERREVLPVDPARRTEIDKQRVPMSARPYRLLALVKQDAVVRVQKEPDDTVMTWPHLLSIEFLAAGVMSIFLLLMGLFINAPLEELANGNVTPAVAKAPWYFLGLQELLAYFHPTVAGVLVPTFVLVGAAFIPYIDRENILATRPSPRHRGTSSASRSSSPTSTRPSRASSSRHSCWSGRRSSRTSIARTSSRSVPPSGRRRSCCSPSSASSDSS